MHLPARLTLSHPGICVNNSANPLKGSFRMESMPTWRAIEFGFGDLMICAPSMPLLGSMGFVVSTFDFRYVVSVLTCINAIVHMVVVSQLPLCAVYSIVDDRERADQHNFRFSDCLLMPKLLI